MEYMKLENNSYKKEQLEKVCESIRKGKIVIVPTDTVYGIVCDSKNDKAVSKIYKIKHRESTNPLSILVSDIDMIKSVTKEISETEEGIIKRFFPGGLTIILKKNANISDIVTANLDSVGVRMPDSQFLIEIIKRIRKTYCCNKFKYLWRKMYK